MTDNMFDKFVSDKLRDHQSPVPPGLWEKIERKKDRDPRGGFWIPRTALLAGFLLIIAGLGVGYYLLQESEPNTANGAKHAAAKNAVSAPDNEKNTTTGFNSNENNTHNTGKGTVNEGGNTTTSATPTNNNITDDNNATTANNTGNAGASKNKKIQSSHSTDNNNSNNTSVVKKVKRSKQQRAGLRNEAGSTVVPDNAYTNTGSTSNTNNTIATINGKKKTSRNTNDKGKNTLAATIDEATTNNATTNNTSAVEQELLLAKYNKGNTALNLRKLTAGGKNQFDLSKLKIWGIDCPTAGRLRRNDWYVEPFVSVDKAFKSVSGSAAYVNKKDSTETTQLGYTAGVRISRSITENILLKTGLEYSQINERFDQVKESERRIITVVTIRTITLPSGLDSTISDTTSLEQIGYTVRRTYNRYRSLNIPLIASYEFGGDKLKFAVNAGVILNLRSWYSGESLNDSLAVVPLNSKTNSIYKQNIGLGIYAGFSIIKPLRNNAELFFEPYFRYNLSNMSTGAFSQKFNSAGLAIGIRYKLNGQRRRW